MARWWQSGGKVYRVKEVRTYPASAYRPEGMVHTTYYGPYSSETGARSFAGKRRNNIQGPSTAVVTLEEATPEWSAV